MVFGGMRFGAALLALAIWLASAPVQADEPSEPIVEVRSEVELMLMEGRTNELGAMRTTIALRGCASAVAIGRWSL